MKKTLLTAHSGCENTAENSLESIQTGIALGADCVEVDVRLSQDGTLVLSHDAPETAHGLVTLAEAFGKLPDSVSVNCDLKQPDALYPTLELAQRCGIERDRLIFSGSVPIAQLQRDASIARRCRIFLNSEEICRFLMNDPSVSREAQAAFFMQNMEFIADFMKKLGAEALNAPYLYVSDEAIAALRRLGVELSLWTVNDADTLRHLLEKDILNITTRCVQTALELRSQV